MYEFCATLYCMDSKTYKCFFYTCKSIIMDDIVIEDIAIEEKKDEEDIIPKV